MQMSLQAKRTVADIIKSVSESPEKTCDVKKSASDIIKKII